MQSLKVVALHCQSPGFSHLFSKLTCIKSLEAELWFLFDSPKTVKRLPESFSPHISAIIKKKNSETTWWNKMRRWDSTRKLISSVFNVLRRTILHLFNNKIRLFLSLQGESCDHRAKVWLTSKTCQLAGLSRLSLSRSFTLPWHVSD